jgi:hypothetical protein
MKKKLLSTISVTLVCSMLATASPCYAAVIEDDTIWTFSAAGTHKGITSDYTYEGLTIKATSDKAVDFDGTVLQLNGGGSTSARCITFTATSGCTISIECKSTSSDTRTLNIADKDGTVIGTISATSSYATVTFTYTGYGEDLYIYSAGKGISIKSMSISYDNSVRKGDVDNNKTIDGKDAAALLKQLTGASPLAGNLSLSAANPDNNGVINLLDAIWILSHQKDAGSGYTPSTSTVDTSDGTIVATYSDLSTAVINGTAKIYITNDIDCEGQIALKKGNQSIIGVPQTDGTLPVLNFDNMTGGKDIINESSSDGDVGVRVTSNNNTISNLVIEHAHDNGIQIKGEEVTGNTVTNCIVRYNNDSGVQITGGSYNNVLKNVYSYRNCDVFTRGNNADGFAVKLGAGPVEVTKASEFQNSKNTFENCFAWDNGDDAWDSYDYPADEQSFKSGNTRWTYKNEYTNCMCWGNGSAATHVGYTDYVNSMSLDEELPVIRRIKALVSEDTYNSFKTAYNNGTLGSRSMTESQYYAAVDKLTKVSIPTNKKDSDGNLLSMSIAEYVAAWGGNPNGFKMGSKYTQSISERTLTNCIAFDHTAAGFDKNNSTCNVELQNAISFNNNINYHLQGMTAQAWSNVYGWNGGTSDDLATGASGVSVKVNKPSSTSKTEKLVRAAAEDIKASAAENKFITTDIFSTAFN